MGWGNPVAAGIRLELKRMNTLREHPWQDMTCTVEAGCTWAAMQAELARHGQMVALDPLWPERATVGGVVATNDSGALRLKYGGLRDLIIGMTIVLADGTIAKTGGKVVKNVAGYDLHKLMTGGFGTLGVIAEVNFRLHPVEANARTWTAVAPECSRICMRRFERLLDSQMTPLIGATSRAQAGMRARCPHCGVAGVHGRTCGRACERSWPAGRTEGSSESVWQARQELFEIGGRGRSEGLSVARRSLSRERGVAAMGGRRRCRDRRCGSGNRPDDGGSGSRSPVRRLLSSSNFAGGCVASGAAWLHLGVPQVLRGGLDVWGCDSNALPLMREIKRRFDPNRILNPGRFVGNI